jgi:excisionase family DNA binding protein
MSSEDPEWLTVRAAAQLLGVHENTVRNMCDDGRLIAGARGKFRKVSAESVKYVLVGSRTSPDVISQIRDAYDEALADATGGKISPQFLFGMRYVMCLLDMPEGISLGADQGGTRSVTRRAAHAHYVSTYCIHDNHDACRLTCKTCGAPCRCDDPECTHD